MEDYRKADGGTARCIWRGPGHYWTCLDEHRGVTERQAHLLRKRSDMEMKWVHVARRREGKAGHLC